MSYKVGPGIKAWYNSLSDLEGDVGSILGGARQATNAAAVLNSNLSNITQPRINVSTLLYAGLAVGGAYLLLRRRSPRRNPRGRRR